jgi:hypothetical protein
VTPAHATDDRLMSDADYKSFLSEVEGKLPEWEAALKKVDPAKSDASYAVGEKIVEFRDLALREVGYVRQYVAKQRGKRTVSGELALEGFLRGVYDTMDSVVAIESSARLTLSHLENFAPPIGKLVISIGNDVTARVELLEKGNCP